MSSNNIRNAQSFLHAAIIAIVLLYLRPACAVDIIRVPAVATAINILPYVDPHASIGEEILLSTAPAADGIVRRIAVKAIKHDGMSNWVIFALKNESSERLKRWVVAPREILVGSSIWHAELRGPHVVNLSSNIGINPAPIPAAEADIFEIEIEAGSSTTYVAELSGVTLPALEIWDPDAYVASSLRKSAIKLISLEFSNVMVIALSVLALLHRRWSYLGAAFFAWTVGYYQIYQFGYLDSISIPLDASTGPLQQSITTIVLLAGLVILVLSQLDWRRWNLKISSTLFFSIILVTTFTAVAWIDSTIALEASKIAFFFVAIVSMLTYVLLALLRDRSAALILPTLALTIGWLVWYVAAATAKYPVWCYQDYMINAGLSVVLLAITTTKIFSNPRLASLNTAAKSKQIAKLMASTTALAAMTSAMFFVIFSGISVQISINRDLLADRLGIARGKFIVEKEKKSEPLVEIKSPKASIDVDIVVVDQPTDIKAINDDTLAVRDIEAQVRAAQKSDLMTSTSDTKGKTK